MSTALMLALLGLAVLPWCLQRPLPGIGALGAHRRRRPMPEVRVDAAVALDILAAAIGAGAPVPAALEALGAAMPPDQGRPIVRAAAVLHLGGDWDSAWESAGADLEPLHRALRPAWVDGVAPDALLDQAARTIRARRLTAAKDAAARLGVRLVLPMGVCLLPAFVLLGLVPVLLSAGGGLLS